MSADRGVTAGDLAAGEAHAQVDGAQSLFDAALADGWGGGVNEGPALLQVRADGAHGGDEGRAAGGVDHPDRAVESRPLDVEDEADIEKQVRFEETSRPAFGDRGPFGGEHLSRRRR
jgi:hypothetical protein